MEVQKWGTLVKEVSLQLILDFMRSRKETWANGPGLTQTAIFQECGLDWGDCQNAKSSQQQFWVVAALRTLEKNGLVERISQSGPWRLTKKGN